METIEYLSAVRSFLGAAAQLCGDAKALRILADLMDETDARLRAEQAPKPEPEAPAGDA